MLNNKYCKVVLDESISPWEGPKVHTSSYFVSINHCIIHQRLHYVLYSLGNDTFLFWTHFFQFLEKNAKDRAALELLISWSLQGMNTVGKIKHKLLSGSLDLGKFMSNG